MGARHPASWGAALDEAPAELDDTEAEEEAVEAEEEAVEADEAKPAELPADVPDTEDVAAEEEDTGLELEAADADELGAPDEPDVMDASPEFPEGAPGRGQAVVKPTITHTIE